jgi:hypothetical protein
MLGGLVTGVVEVVVVLAVLVVVGSVYEVVVEHVGSVVTTTVVSVDSVGSDEEVVSVDSVGVVDAVVVGSSVVVDAVAGTQSVVVGWLMTVSELLGGSGSQAAIARMAREATRTATNFTRTIAHHPQSWLIPRVAAGASWRQRLAENGTSRESATYSGSGLSF